MSMGTPFTAGSAEAGETVASFSQYEKAQKAVSALIAAEVPAKEIAIVGQGLRSIERVTGRLGYAAAARSGAVNGLVLGVLFAFIFVLGTPTVAIQAFVGVLLIGMAIGMLLSIVMYSIVRRRRDYASVMQVVADHYDVRVVASSVHRARAALGTATTAADPAPAAARPQPAAPVERPAAPAPAAPPRYGERVEPKPATPPTGADDAPERSDRA
jgi:predicted lipid-binding transport protein (Tim44 family)